MPEVPYARYVSATLKQTNPANVLMDENGKVYRPGLTPVDPTPELLTAAAPLILIDPATGLPYSLSESDPDEVRAYSKSRIRKITSIGDSIITYQGTFGVLFAPPVNVTGVQIRYGSLDTPAGNMTLAYNKSDNTFTYTAPGDTPGEPIPAVDGLFWLRSGNPLYALRIGVWTRSLPTVDAVDVLASGLLYWRRGPGSIQYVVDALTNRRFVFTEDYGISGNRTSDIIKRYDQVLKIKADLIIDEGGTNDITAGSLSASSVVSNRNKMWDMAAKQGTPVIGLTVSPRFGIYGANGVPGEIAAPGVIGQTIVLANTGLVNTSYAENRKGMFIADNFRSGVDTTTGRAVDYITSDGVHNAGTGALNCALPIVGILDTLSPNVQPGSSYNIGVGSYYSAATNPSGNLLTSPQGSFGGSNGTLTAGLSSLTPRWFTAVAAVAGVSHAISSGNLYRASTSGNTGVVPPTHEEGCLSDGGVVWQFLGSGVLIPWLAATPYGLGEQVVTAAGRRYVCMTAGTTSATEPTSLAFPVVDGTVSWRYIDNSHSSGFGTGYTVSRATGTGSMVSFHKVIDPDGGPDWQEMVMWGAVRDVCSTSPEELRINPTGPVIGNFTAGDLVDTSIQCQLPYDSPKTFYGIRMDQIYTGYIINHDNSALSSCFRGLPWSVPFTLALEPIVFRSAMAAIQPRIMVQVRNNVATYLRLRSFDVHKVIAPVIEG